MPGLFELFVAGCRQEIVWLPEDSLLDAPDVDVHSRQGIYQDQRGRWRMD